MCKTVFLNLIFSSLHLIFVLSAGMCTDLNELHLTRNANSGLVDVTYLRLYINMRKKEKIKHSRSPSCIRRLGSHRTEALGLILARCSAERMTTYSGRA